MGAWMCDQVGQWATNAAVVFKRDSVAVVARPAVSTGSERLADGPFGVAD